MQLKHCKLTPPTQEPEKEEEGLQVNAAGDGFKLDGVAYGPGESLNHGFVSIRVLTEL